MQTILGSGGAIGVDLAKELYAYTDKVRLVSRNPEKVTEKDERMPADLTKPDQVEKAVEGSEIVYVTIGFEYNARVWQKTWPPFMRSVIEACKKHNSKLVFFDNMYMYGPDEVPHMTEESKIDPSSKKGKVRMDLHYMIMNEVKEGKLKALIARSADFYGPGIGNSVLQEVVMKNLREGKAAFWFINANLKHSFTYTPDAAKGTAILGNTPDAYGQVWHLPTHPDALTGKQWVDLFAKELAVEPRVRVMPKFMLSLAALFTPVLKEFKELTYQWDREYIFDSSKFEKRFDYKPTPYAAGVKEVVRSS
jgi:nucleoside-diphosphate-sugar epimerase